MGNSISKIEKIYNDRLCLGCGLCESVCGKEAVQMKLQPDGFFRPVVKKILEKEEEIIERICPGKNIINDLTFDKNQSVWGKIEQILSANSTDPEIRVKGSSGGIVSAIAVSMLKNSKADAVLQVGGDSNDYERNTLKISKTRNDVIHCASSRYAPALIFDKINEILDSSQDTYCFIGKPCDISALKNFLAEFPIYQNRFKLMVSIMCAGMPSFNGTKAIITDFKATFPVKNLVYRGNGWPGYFSFIDKNDNNYQKTYNDSWGKTLNRHLNFRCKICPDGIGLQADIAVGDAWETKDGYPDFTEREGSSLVIVRTQSGIDILDMMKRNQEMESEDVEEQKIKMMQPYQYDRRTRVGIRYLAYRTLKRNKVTYKNMHIWYNLKFVKPLVLLKEFTGTSKRILKNRN